MAETRPSLLMVFSKFGRDTGSRYLTNDLADAFAERGFAVRVIHLPWEQAGQGGEDFYVQENGVEVLVSHPVSMAWLGRVGGLCAKWGGSSLLAAQRGRRRWGRTPAEMVIGMSPIVVGAFIWLWSLRRARLGSYAYLVDFFPFHHRAIGVMPGGVIFRLARWLENVFLRRFTVVGCMSPRGLDYLAANYDLRPRQATGLVSLWGPQSLAGEQDPAATRRRHGLPTDRPIVVFGGQITYGRGIEDVLVCAAMANRGETAPLFLFIGSGPLTPLVREAAESGAGNVRLLAELGRDDYLALVSACDVGLVATVRDVDVPTFPSKTIDYLRAGIPVVASVEATTDFDDFVRDQGFGLAVTAGDPPAMLAAIEAVLADDGGREEMVAAGRRTLREVFNVDTAVTRMLAQLALAGSDDGATDMLRSLEGG